MKLSLKMFFGICIPAVISCLVIAAFLIEKNLDENIDAETQIAIKNVEKIENRIKYNVNSTILFTSAEKSNTEKDVKIYYYNNNKLEYETDEVLQPYADEFKTTENNKYIAQQKEINDKNYIFVSTKMGEDKTIVYIEDIDYIYNSRSVLIKNCIYIWLVMIVFIAIIAYIISKTLTKPLVKIQKEMEKLSKGDYKINLKESNSEFGKLAKSFNKMSKELEKRNNDLIESANNKQLFIDNLSHEMNTPLTSIQGYAELLQKANLTEEQKDKYLTYIQSESKRISDMYKKLLLLSYKKNADLDFKNVNISNVFSEIYKSQKNRLDSKNIDLIINNQLENIYGDETLIIMCVSNLVKNAINVSDVNSKIIINALKINDKKYIQVVDYGPGISKENIAKITEPFYRVDKVRSRKNGGAGLGLSKGEIKDMQAFIVKYKNKKVTAVEVDAMYKLSSIDDETDIIADPNNGLVNYYTDLENGCENMIYDINNETPKQMDIYGYYTGGENEGTWFFKELFYRAVPTISEEEYNSIKAKYDKYKFYKITTELTSENIDEYIK